jgi:serine/threonine protein kinase
MKNGSIDKTESKELQVRSTASGTDGGCIHQQDTLPMDVKAKEQKSLGQFREYQLLEELGGGGMGQVYKAFHTKLKRTVALKVIRAHLVNDPAAVVRFDREMEIIARLDHPNIVRALDAGEVDGTRFLVMELLEGRNASQVVEEGRLDLHQACDIARQAADALQHVHDQGLVHRDVKPSNFLLTVSGQVKVLDLGIARWKMPPDGQPLTPNQQVLGTFDYLAPEQIDNPGAVDGRADIYSLGCTLYHLLAGRPPFTGLAPLQKLLAHHGEKPKSLSVIRPELPNSLVKVVNKMMAKNAADRYSSAACVAEALRPFCKASISPIEHEPRLGKVESRGKGHHSIWSLVCASVMLALLLIGAAGVVVRVNTSQGTMVLEFPQGIPDNAEVLVDGDKVTLKRITPGQGEITIAAGQRVVEVRAGKDFWRQENVTVSRGGKPVLQVALVPNQAAVVAKKPATAGGSSAPAQSNVAVGPIISLAGHTGPIMCLAVSPDGRFAVSHGGLGDSALHLWDLSKQRQLYKISNAECDGLAVLWTRDGRAVLLGGNGDRGAGAVVLQDARTGRRLGNMISHERPVRSVALSVDGKLFASADDTGLVRVWDFKTGAKLHDFQHSLGVYSVAFSPGGKHVLTGCADKNMRLWSLDKDAQERLFEGHTATVSYVAFLDAGRQALSATYSPLGDSDCTVRLWDVATGKETNRLQVGEERDRLDSAAISPDGRRVLTGHLDGSVCLWDLATKKKLAGFSKHKGKVISVAFTPDGRFALSGDDGGTSGIWLYRLPNP